LVAYLTAAFPFTPWCEMPPRATRFLPSEVPRFVADVRPVETLIEPIAGVGAVIIATCSSPKRDNNAEIVDYHGTRNLIEQPAAADVELVVFIWAWLLQDEWEVPGNRMFLGSNGIG